MTLMQRIPAPTPASAVSEFDVPATPAGDRPRLAVVPRLSAEERRQREDAVRFANASIGLEGFKVSAEAQARADRFIAGEIDLAEFLQGK